MKPACFAAMAGLLFLAGCAAGETPAVFVPSKKSAVELRAMQSRIIDDDQNNGMRDVIAALQDLGYRVTKAEPGAGTVSATRLTGLRLAAVIRERAPGQCVVRVNATVLSPREEVQVDDPQFYLKNFFVPLGDTMGRQSRVVRDDETVPDAMRPVAETNTGKQAPQPPASPAAPGAATVPTGTQTP